MSSVRDNFKDAEQASYYAKYRPVYPPTVLQNILDYLASSVEEKDKRRKLAVDVGCGSGQGTLPLCQHFESVIGMDTSEEQVDQARLKVVQGEGKVTFRVGVAEDLSFLEDNSVDLITVATAIHWFDVEKFCVECFRVLRAGGVLAAYSYGFGNYTLANGQDISHFNDQFRSFMKEKADPQTTHVDDKYARIFPVFENTFPHTKRDDSVTLEMKYSVEGIQGFVKSLSTYRKIRATDPDKPDPVDKIRDQLMKAYNNDPPEDAVTCSHSVFIIMAKK